MGERMDRDSGVVGWVAVGQCLGESGQRVRTGEAGRLRSEYVGQLRLPYSIDSSS